jgi:hypothetical protein
LRDRRVEESRGPLFLKSHTSYEQLWRPCSGRTAAEWECLTAMLSCLQCNEPNNSLSTAKCIEIEDGHLSPKCRYSPECCNPELQTQDTDREKTAISLLNVGIHQGATIQNCRHKTLTVRTRPSLSSMSVFTRVLQYRIADTRH